MFLIILLNTLFASTFTLGKAALAYTQPIFFVGIRMLVAGLLLLGYHRFFSKHDKTIHKSDWFLFIQLMVFQIYIAFVGEYWALQYITSAKASLLYSLAPFLTALFSYGMFKEQITGKKIIGLVAGFVGFIVIACTQTQGERATEHFLFFSSAELILLISVASAAYGWLVLKKLMHRGYSFAMINGVGMFGGGVFAFVTSLVQEHNPLTISVPQHTSAYAGLFESFIRNSLPQAYASIFLFLLYMVLLIIIANIICYNLYGYLLHYYSATLLSFSGLMIPFITAFFGWIFLGEQITLSFFVSALLIFCGLYIFYKEDLVANQQLQKK